MHNETEIIRENPQQEEGLSLKDIFYIVKKHIVAIAASVVVFTAAGLGGAVVKDKIAPTYTSSATMMVSVNNDSYWGNIAGSTAYSLSNYITDTFCDFIKDDVVLDKVAEEVADDNYHPSAKSIRSNLSASGNNLVLKLSYNASSKEMAVKTLKAVTKYTVEVANGAETHTEIVGGETKTIVEADFPFLYKSISIMTDAKESTVVTASSKTKLTVIGFAVGAVVAFAYVFLREMFNNSFVSNDDVEKTLGLPILASVPSYEFKDETEKKEGK